MASVTPTKSRLHYSIPKFSALAHSRSCFINYSKTHLGFQTNPKWRKLSLDDRLEEQKFRRKGTGGTCSLENNTGVSISHVHDNVRKHKGGRAGCGGVVRCTAERGLLVGGGGGGAGERSQEGVGLMVAERFKVVALVACIMCLCNADRVVMSVAIVPLAAQNGWSSSFLGIVQVILFYSGFYHYPCLLATQLTSP